MRVIFIGTQNEILKKEIHHFEEIFITINDIDNEEEFI